SVLYLVVGEKEVNTRIIMMDRRDRWSAVELMDTSFVPDLIVACPDGGAWAFDKSNNRLARVWGMPLRDRPLMEYQAGVGRPCNENRDPPHLEMRDDLLMPADYEVISMACNTAGDVIFLLWPDTGGGDAALVLLRNNTISDLVPLSGVQAPFSIGWAAKDRVALLFAAMTEAIVYRLIGSESESVATASAEAVGDRYPLNGWNQFPFCNAVIQPVHYPAVLAGDDHPRPLHRLSMPGLAKSATVDCTTPIDSGQIGTEWHRVYIEASIPKGTGITLSLSASDDVAQLSVVERFPHCFGVVSDNIQQTFTDIPVGAWVSDHSEIPFHAGLLDCPAEKDTAGLFTALVQRADKTVRSLRGRYLQIQVELNGDGYNTPELAAIRVYGARFSYLDHYLPELYRETVFGPPADLEAAATGADFLQRYLGLFEGILTPLEDKVAAAHLVTDPASAPEDALEWLSQWVGLTLEPGLPEARKRRMIAEATNLYRKRGTLRGLSLALNVATGDWVARGGIVILEDFRLRRTFATILGADLAAEEDPLMMGIVQSGNSYVGDTLFLGEEEKKEFLALYQPDIAETEQEREAVEAFFERLAYRITILVHRDISKQELGIIRRIVQLESPAHIEARVLAASASLLVGLSALVGVDTVIGEQPLPQPVHVNKSIVGRGDYVLGKGSLDPRLEGAGTSAMTTGE
ncbi:MAG: phage tail protein, partial [Gammaproteobacteria bacterium]